MIINKSLSFGFCIFAELIKLFSRIESIIGISASNELFCILSVKWFAVALSVWSKFFVFPDGFIRWNSQPFQSFKNILFGSFYKTGLIRIFDTQIESSIVFFCK